MVRPLHVPIMSLPPDTLGAAEESAVRRHMAAAAGRIRRLRRVDRVAVGIITLGGIGVILSVVAILVFIAAEALPLFKPAAVAPLGTIRLAGQPAVALPAAAAMGADEFGRHLYSVDADGTIALFDPATGARGQQWRPTALQGATITAVTRSLAGDHVALGTSDGRVVLLQVQFAPVYEENRLSGVSADLVEGPVVTVDPNGRPVQRVSYVEHDGRRFVAAQISDTDVRLWWNDYDGNARDALVSTRPGDPVLAVAVGRHGTAIAGTERGEVHHWELGDSATLTDVAIVGPTPVTALAYVIGNHTFIAGTADGRVSSWFRAPVGTDGAPLLVRISEFEAQSGPITAIAATNRDRTFAAGNAEGAVVLRHQTSGRTLAVVPGQQPVTHLMITPRSDGLIVAREDGTVDRFSLANPHPEISLKTLFGKTWYEEYAGPEYVWQSTAATDDFEPKLSLVPLVFGTLKGTVYALLFAVPLAVAGALYTSQFVSPALRAKVKPTIEIMAALPSVVIGFVAGLYMAPIVERHLVGVGLLIVALPVFGTSGLLIWSAMPGALRRRLKAGTELAIILPMLVVGGWLALTIAPGVENIVFGGDARQWLSTTLGLTYDQRNSLVVGIAMGFAVIPIIFTISEDGFSSVPPNLAAASLALGASRWQTAVRVIIPTASPAVFSAVMIGFGRAVGETMIVLMATGNTPVLDWSIFNGFRTLSANIAVEIPEAPHGGTLYRTLFLAAAVLFVMTFTLNTIAEVVRQRLREKYKAI